MEVVGKTPAEGLVPPVVGGTVGSSRSTAFWGAAAAISARGRPDAAGLGGAGEAQRRGGQRGRSQVLEAALSRIVGRDGDATPKCNLPQQLTSLVGRRPELDEIVALLREHQLVTVVGAGGVGKTRIVVQLGSEVLERYADGVWFVDLAPLADQDHVPSAIASVLKLPSGLGSAAEAVVAFVKPRRLLLILDNCEHVAARAREIAASIAQACPDAGVLSTSRQAL